MSPIPASFPRLPLSAFQLFSFSAFPSSAIRHPLSALGAKRPPISHLLSSIFCAVLLCAATAHATSITLQGGFGYPNAKDPAGNPLEAGHKVSVGTFDPGPDIAPDEASRAAWVEANKSNLPALLAAWKQFAFTTTDVIHGESGAFWLQASHRTGIDPQGHSYPGKKIYLLLTRTDAAYSEPAADASNVRDFAIFTAPAWTFPAPPSDSNLPPNDLRALNTSQITTAIAGTADPATGLFALASYSSGSDGNTDPASAFDQWLAATFGANSTVTHDSIVGPAGLTALATYALATTPEATAPPYTTVTDENGRIGIEFTRKLNSGFATHAQACTTLSEWTLPVTESVVSTTTDTETVRAFPDFPADSDTTKAFFRIRVEPAN